MHFVLTPCIYINKQICSFPDPSEPKQKFLKTLVSGENLSNIERLAESLGRDSQEDNNGRVPSSNLSQQMFNILLEKKLTSSPLPESFQLDRISIWDKVKSHHSYNRVAVNIENEIIPNDISQSKSSPESPTGSSIDETIKKIINNDQSIDSVLSHHYVKPRAFARLVKKKCIQDVIQCGNAYEAAIKRLSLVKDSLEKASWAFDSKDEDLNECDPEDNSDFEQEKVSCFQFL